MTTQEPTQYRPSRDEYFFKIANAVSEMATCPRARCGCVLVDPKTHYILSTGYNGSESGEPHCFDEGCILVDGHCKRAVHAEENAIKQAKLHNINTEGAVAYIVKYNRKQENPSIGVRACPDCRKSVADAGITIKGERGNPEDEIDPEDEINPKDEAIPRAEINHNKSVGTLITNLLAAFESGNLPKEGYASSDDIVSVLDMDITTHVLSTYLLRTLGVYSTGTDECFSLIQIYDLLKTKAAQ